jgi:hypothetical protein
MTTTICLKRIVIALTTIWLCPGCHVKEDSSRSRISASSISVNRAEKVWRENERIVKGALSGHAYSPDRFGDACAFFENVAGIEIRGRGTFFGWLPNEYSAADFERVESWYSVNRSRLYWDEASRSVKVNGAKVTM